MTSREYLWHRAAFRGNTYEREYSIELDEVVEGWTLMKTRFGLMLTDHLTPSFDNTIANQTVFGIIMLPAASSPVDPVIDTSADWIWWEGVHTTREVMPLTVPPYSLSKGPVPFGARESDSRRLAPVDGSRIWLAWTRLDPYGDVDGDRYFQFDIWCEFLWLKPLGA